MSCIWSFAKIPSITLKKVELIFLGNFEVNSWNNSSSQAAVGKDSEKQQQAETSSVHRIRIVLTACNVRSLEKVCADLISGAKKQKLRVKVSKTC